MRYLKILYRILPEAILIKNYFRLNRKNFQFSLIRNHDFHLITQRTVRHGQNCQVMNTLFVYPLKEQEIGRAHV